MRTRAILLFLSVLLATHSAQSMDIGVCVSITEIAKLPIPARTAAFRALVDTLAANNIEHIRVSIPFWNLVPPDTTQAIDFSSYDEFVLDASAHGIHILAILAYGHPAFALPLSRFDCTWPPDYYVNGQLSNSTLARSAPDTTYWKYYVRSVVTHYQEQVDSWEIWNEQNMFGPFYLGTVDEYRDLLRTAAHIIRNRDSSSVIALGGLATLPYEGTSWLECFLRGGSSVYNLFDVMNIHVYELDADYALATVSDALDSLSLPTKPIWISEAGLTNSPDPGSGQFHSVIGQAFHIPFLMSKFRAADVSRVYWYTFNCALYGDACHFSLVNFADANYTSIDALESWPYLRAEIAAQDPNYAGQPTLEFRSRSAAATPLFGGLYPYQRCNLYDSNWPRFSTFELCDAYGRAGVLTNVKPATVESGLALTGIAIDVDDRWAAIDSNRTGTLCEIEYAQADMGGGLQVLYDRADPNLPCPTDTDTYTGCLAMLSSGECNVSETNTYTTYYDGALSPSGLVNVMPSVVVHSSFVRAVAYLDSTAWQNRLYRKADLFVRMSDGGQFYMDQMRLVSRTYPAPLVVPAVGPRLDVTQNIRLGGSTLYVCNGMSVKRYSVANAESVLALPDFAALSLPFAATGLGNVMCVAEGPDGLGVYDIANEAIPVRLDVVEDDGWAIEVAMHEDVALVGFQSGHLRIYDVANPSNVTLLKELNLNSIVHRIVVRAGVALVLTEAALFAIDISVPSQAAVVERLALPVGLYPYDLADGGSHVYVAAGERGIVCVNAESVDAMYIECTLDAPGMAWSCAADDSQLIIGCSGGIVTYRVNETNGWELWGYLKAPEEYVILALKGGLLLSYSGGVSGDSSGWASVARAGLATAQIIVLGSVSAEVVVRPGGEADWIFRWKTAAWNVGENDAVEVCAAAGRPAQCVGQQFQVSGAGVCTVRMGPDGLFLHTLTAQGMDCIPGQVYKYRVSSSAGGEAAVSEERTFATAVCIE